MLPLIIAVLLAALVYVVLVTIHHQKRKSLTSNNNYSFDYTALIKFVEKADDAYILTHATLDIMYFSKFASSRVCNELIEFLYRNPPKMFGSKKFRKRDWYILDYQKNAITLKKTITHQYVKVKRGMKIKLGDDMVEYWDISIESNGFRVQAVNADSDLEEEVY